jgi:hypothetical protein
MNYGKTQEPPHVDLTIKKLGLPKADPMFGMPGCLFD